MLLDEHSAGTGSALPAAAFHAVRPDGSRSEESDGFAWGVAGRDGIEIDRICHASRRSQIAYAAGWRQVLPPVPGHVPVVVTGRMRADCPELAAEAAAWAADLAAVGQRASWVPTCPVPHCGHGGGGLGACVAHVDRWGTTASTGRQQLTVAHDQPREFALA